MRRASFKKRDGFEVSLSSQSHIMGGHALLTGDYGP